MMLNHHHSPLLSIHTTTRLLSLSSSLSFWRKRLGGFFYLYIQLNDADSIYIFCISFHFTSSFSRVFHLFYFLHLIYIVMKLKTNRKLFLTSGARLMKKASAAVWRIWICNWIKENYYESANENKEIYDDLGMNNE